MQNIQVKRMFFLMAALLCFAVIHTACEKREAKQEVKSAQRSDEAKKPSADADEETLQVRRIEKTAYRQIIRGQIKGKGRNAYWGNIPQIGRIDLKKSSYNTYSYSANVEVQIHKNDGKQLVVDYTFHELETMELISDRQVSIGLDSGWLPPGLPSGLTLKEEYIQFIENRFKELEDKIPPHAKKLIDYAGTFLAFRSPQLNELQDTALGLKGKTVRVVKTVGRSQIQEVGFKVTREQRDFINRLSLTVDVELFPDDKKQGDQWQADAFSLGFIFDPLMPGEFRGPVEIEYVNQSFEEGRENAQLKIRRAPVEFISDEGNSRGTFNGWGEILCLLPARLVTNVNLEANGEFQGFPKSHLLYGMQYEGQPEFEAISRIEPIPYVEKK